MIVENDHYSMNVENLSRTRLDSHSCFDVVLSKLLSIRNNHRTKIITWSNQHIKKNK